jgi:hypothetical protein
LKFLKVNKEIIDFLNTHGNKGYQLIVNNILTIINELFTQNKNVNETNQQLQVLLYENYIKIAECLNQSDLGNVILTKIISISLDNDSHIMMNNNNNNNKVISGFSYENLKLVIKMIAAISYKLEHNYNEQFILPQLLMLSQNKSEMIKLEICGIIPQFSKYISLESINTKINHIFLNGNKAYDLFIKKYPHMKNISTKLLSTSSANARCSLELLIDNWKIILDYLN